MAARNAADTVAEAIRSLQRQTHEDWELLLVDDASEDSTSRLVRELAVTDERIVLLANDTRRGLAASLNLAWRRSRGPLVARMDADDVSAPWRLERQVAFMSVHPEVHVLGTAARLVDTDGTELGVHVRPGEHAELVVRMYKEVPFIHPTVMARRSFYETFGGYDERLQRAQDVDLWLRSYRQARFANLTDPLLTYRVQRTPSWSAIWFGSYVLARAAHREGMLTTHGWYALRYAAATTLAKGRIRSIRLANAS